MIVKYYEQRHNEQSPWEAMHQHGVRAKDGGEYDWDWLTVVYDEKDAWSMANTHDMILNRHGGHFPKHLYRAVEIEFNPEKHYLQEAPREYRN